MPKHLICYPPVDFSVPFKDLRPEDIDIYFHYDSTVGSGTCKARCAHCYFLNRPQFHIPVDRALAITASLRGQGYNIGMAPADSFGDEALDAGDAGSAFRLQAIGNSAWSSGVPLCLPGWERKLDRAWAMGFRSIIISAHEAAGTPVPIAGVTKAAVVKSAFRNVRSWNERNAPNRFSRAATFTIRRDNCDLGLMRQMAAWGIEEELDLVRFNCFANFGLRPEHERFEMRREDIVRFFGYLAAVQEEFLQASTSLGISEDWGDAGIEQVYPYLPPEWHKKRSGWCRAGYRLFAMIEVEGEVVVTGCVDAWKPIMGKLVEKAPGDYAIEWDYAKIETIRQAVLGEKVYACWGGVGCKRTPDAGFGSDSVVEEQVLD